MNKMRKIKYFHGLQVKGTTMGKSARRWAKRRLAKKCRRIDRQQCSAT